MSPTSTRICVPNLVAVRRSCRKKGGGTDRQTDRQTDIQTDKGKMQLYIVDARTNNALEYVFYLKKIITLFVACRTKQ